MKLLSSLLHRLPKSPSLPAGAGARAHARLQLARLEDRTVPTTLTWTGAVNANWNTSGNWNAGGMATAEVPDSPDDILVFTNGASILATNNDINSLIVSELQIDDMGYTLGGNAVELVAGLTDSTATGSNTISLSLSGTGATLSKSGASTLELSGANTYTGATTVSAGTLQLAGGAALDDTSAVTVATGATLALSADETIGSLGGAGAVDLGTFALTTGGNNGSTTLSGAVSGTGTLFKNGTGTFTLSGTNTYGGTTVLNGTLSITADANLGTGQVILGPGSTLQVTGATTINNPLITPGAATINNSAAVEISAAISGPGGITKTGTGTLTLAATNTYTGATTVTAGTLLVDGAVTTSSGVQVASGATLGGTGDVPAVAAANGATVAPGGTPGRLSTGDLALATGSIFGAEITENGPATPSTPNDQAVVTGTVDVTGATLAVTLGFVPVAVTSYVLIENDGVDAVTGTFAGLAEGATFTSGGVGFTISYVGGDGNDVVVTTLPPTVSIANVTAAEGNSGGTNFTFTVTLSAPSSQTVTVAYATAGGTATEGADFAAASGALTFAPGETSMTVTVTVTGDTAAEPDETFAVVLSNPVNATIATGTGAGTITNDDTASKTVVSIGAGTGSAGTVRPVDPVTGERGAELLAFAGFGGEIRVASGDVNGDGLTDTVTGAGAGGMGGHVKVFGADGTLLRSFLAFDGFAGGVFVATGDVNGDGFDDIVVSADAGAAPHVKVFNGADGSLLMSFFAYDAGFLGGVRVATGDVNGDGFDDIVTGSGAGVPAHVKVFSGKDGSLLQSLAPYDAFAGGVFVAVGDVNGDGFDDIVTGSGAGVPAHVKVFSGKDNAQLQSFFAYDAGFLGGVRVGIGSVNGSAAVLTGAGPGAGPHVKAFIDGLEVTSLFVGDTDFRGGVYVG